MNEDIFSSLADLEKRADEVVERARQRVVQMRAEMERQIRARADELARDGRLDRQEIERRLDECRQQMLRRFETDLREKMARLDAARREKVRPAVERVIRAFLDHQS